MSGVVEVHAPAKINLWLRVLAREESGYHTLESLFAAVSLADQLTIARTPRSGVELVVRGEVDTGPVDRNLVYRAGVAFLERAAIGEGVSIELEKRIPSAAGLGGGSSDAAATLRGLNHLFDEPLSQPDLLDLAIRLGSDVPFFLAPTPYALGWGRGERLLALNPLPERQVLIAHPGEAMPTGDAFRRLAELRGSEPVPRARVITLDQLQDWSEVAGLAENDFEEPAFERIPRLAAAKSWMMDTGAAIAMLSGSGASMFGIFNPAAELAPLVSRLESEGWRCWRERTLEHWPSPPAGIDFPPQVR